jgi:hypothetical protein
MELHFDPLSVFCALLKIIASYKKRNALCCQSHYPIRPAGSPAENIERLHLRCVPSQGQATIFNICDHRSVRGDYFATRIRARKWPNVPDLVSIESPQPPPMEKTAIASEIPSLSETTRAYICQPA